METIIFDHEAEAQAFAGELIWQNIPFTVTYAKEDKTIITTMCILKELSDAMQRKQNESNN